ncbi:ABC transporter ATP-binding protein/permease [Crocosphaera sp.]|uniref:ABC transporter ATP-binding protein/permease n=1 Tax=Crocosphaera sp. TaxID=2729996 RepID=UPI002603DDFE|nr:ABC transporter ATP-binding protein/permease [Crocosphaera sp.]MDJ0581056.1 ABC transporter ATP-binding protein/permease [Crocosphaera sp.]
MPQTRFQFNRQLVRHFIETAQPYFFPTELRETTETTKVKYITKNTWMFLGLIVVIVFTVVSLAFLLTIGLTLLSNILFPEFFGDVAGGLIKNVNGFLNSFWPYIALNVIIISGVIFVWQKANVADKWKQWSLLASLLFLSLVVNGLNVIISYTFRFIDNALNQKNEETFYQFMIIYGLVLVVALPIIVIYRYTRLKLGLMWREWLTEHFLNKYFNNRAYYELDSNATNTEVDNPDQRITQDITSFTKVTLDFLLDILDSILTLLSFSAILYGLSKEATGGLIIYAIFGTTVALIVGSRLVSINYNQLRLEANFRYGMVRVRDNAESIAFYRGEALEKRQVTERLMAAIINFDLLIIWQSIIQLFQLGYQFFPRLIPYIIIAPLYLRGDLDFGAIGQTSFAFFQILSALSLITNQIQGISEFAASINRLGEFYESLNPLAFKKEKLQTSFIHTQISSDVALESVTLQPPNSERILIENVSLNVSNDHNLLIMGASGTGKSSLLRAIAGLWNSGEGIIYRPDAEKILFLPQKPYMILGTLREQLLYPNTENNITDAQLEEVLKTVNLPDLAERFKGFEAEENWENVLSLGEQQRVAFARILITKPSYAILDEATSALDVKNEERLYQELSHMGTTYISVGHRPTLSQYHQQLLEIFDGGNWEIKGIEN